MKNRVMAILICMAMLLSMIPANVVAEGVEPEPYAHTTHEGWTAWGKEKTQLPTTSGKYYLTDDIDLAAAAGVDSDQDIVLCLNGKNIDCAEAQRAYRLCKGAKLTICDCTAKTEDNAYKAGSITGAANTAILIGTETPSATLNIYEGIFSQNTITGSGAVIVAQGGSTVNIYGGEFSDNEAGKNGGAIYAFDTTVNMYGGTMKNNTAGSAGGAIYANKTTANLAGGTLSDNTAAFGGGLYVEGASAVTLKGVAIQNNIATSRGAGVDYVGSGTLTVGGTTKVTGNTLGENANNLVLVNGRKLQLDAENAPLVEGAAIGISVCTWSNSTGSNELSGVVQFGTNATQEDAAKYFASDVTGTEHYVQAQNGSLRFALPKPEHPVEHYHTETEWTATDTLPTTSGHYYLSGDVNVTVNNGVVVNSEQNIVLCLNGYTVTGQTRIYRLSKGANVTICDCTAYENEDGDFISGKLVPGTAEGGVANVVADGATTETTLTLKNITIDGTGKTGSNGGAISLGYVGAVVNMDGCLIRNCTATGKGGAIQNHSGTLNVTDTVFTGNTANYGGALILLNASKTTLTDVTITGNTANVYGGGVDNELSTSGTGYLKIQGDTVIQDNYNAKVKHTSNINLLNQSRRVVIGALGENASIGIIAEKNTDSSDLGEVTISEAATEAALAHFTSDMGHDVILDGGKLKIQKRSHTTHATDECGHTSVTWNGTATVPTTAGHYYLTSNVFIDTNGNNGIGLNSGAEITICLNGYSIIAKNGDRLFRLSNGTTLNICDCTGHGKLTGGNKTVGGVAWIGKDASDTDSGTLNLYGGIITGNQAGDTSALIAIPNGTFNMHGGEISGNQSRAVKLENGTFLMAGGKITGNTYNAQDGTAVRVTNGTFTMTGGEISNNENSSNGGTVRIDNGISSLTGGKITGNTSKSASGLLIVGGTVNLEGVEISNNTTSGTGAGVYIMNEAVVSIGAGTRITCNTSNGNGGAGIFVNGTPAVTLNGVVITDNTAANAGGGVYYKGTGTLTISGATQITGNTAGGAASNLHLADGSTFALQTLTEGAAIGITGDLQKMSGDGKLLIGTAAVQQDAAQYFTSDQNKSIEHTDDQLYLAYAMTRPHTAHAKDECGHENVTWQFWADSTTLPTVEGHYYLTEDVTLGTLNGVAFNTGAEVTICLNGFTISGAGAGRVFRLSNGTVVNLCDCTGKGKITDCNNESAGVAWISKDPSDTQAGTLNIYGGAITGCTAGEMSGLFFVNGGSLNLYGGTITENESRILLLSNGSVQIAGGKITGNTFGKKDGGVIRVSNGTFTMTGGEISGNDNGSSSGTVRIDNGTATLTGGKICNNTASGGTGIVVAGGTVTLDGVTITNNKANGSGAGLYVMNAPDLTITGNTVISGNAAKGSTGGIHYLGTGKLTLGGAIKITNNTGSTGISNLYLADGQTFVLQTLTEGAAIGVTGNLLHMSAEGKLLIGTGAAQKDAAKYFTSDQGKTLEQKDGNLYLVHVITATHTAHTKDECGHENVTWQFWADSTTLPTAEGHYYLTEDVTLGNLSGVVYNNGAEVTICLNGFTISGADTGRAFRLSNGTVVNLCDCTGKGKITDCNHEKAGVAWIGKDENDTAAGTLNIYGGIITGCTAGIDSGLFNVAGGGSFNFHGGEISGNDSRIVMLSNGSVQIAGGKICGNTYGQRDGGVVRVGNGTFTMTGGEISGNDNGSSSGTVRIDNGTAAFTGGTISGNTASGGTGIVVAGGTVTLDGVTITNNKANGSGAGLYVMNAPDLTITGNTVISGNAAKGSTGGIHYLGTGKLTLGGAIKITDNTGNTGISNLRLMGGSTFVLQTLTKGASIGITADLSKLSNDGKLLIGTDVVQKDAAAYFTSDQDKTIECEDDKLYLALRFDATHTDHNPDECGHENVTWQFWVDNTTLPTAEGHYYLMQDVTLGALTGVAFNTGAEVTICLNGYTISGAGTGRVFRLSNGTTVNLCDCTGKGQITNCNNQKAGVAWIGMDESDTAPGTLNIYGGIITGCTAGIDSGLFHVDGGNFGFHGGEISGNDSRIVMMPKGSTQITGGKITGNTFGQRDGGILRMNSGTFTMSGGEISDNDNGESSGTLRIDDGTATITGGKITGNKAYCGAAIIMAGGKLTITDTEITDNVASGSGGAIYLFKGPELTLGKGTVISGNSAGNNGGAIYSNTAKITLKDCVITSNKAEKDGGGMHLNGTEATLTNMQITKNSARAGGGMVCGQESKVTITDSQINENTVTFAGGGMVIQSAGDVTLVNSKICKNKNTGGNAGGVYISYQGTLTFKSGAIDGNTAKGFGGGVYMADKMTMSSGSISGNHSGKEGGGIYITEGSRKTADGTAEFSDGVFTMTGGTISYNITDGNGGGVCSRGQRGIFYMYGGTISHNEALNTKSGTGHCGGVLVQGKGSFYMYGGTISDNASHSQGGGVRTGKDCGFGLYGGTITRNTSYRGAGVYSEADFVLENCVITENVAANEGGGLYVSGCKMVMNSGTISNNAIADADEDGVPDGSSGGLTVRLEAECTMNGGQITGNIGKHAGGVVVQSKGVFILNDGLIAENTAQGGYGGGLYNSRSTVRLMGGTFRDNVSTHAGGALFTDGEFTADGCEFIKNAVTAASGGNCSGGALKIGNNAVAVLKNCKFTDNSVLGRSGAIDVSYKAACELDSCTFTGNAASANGGAVGVYGVGKLTVANCLFNGNNAIGMGGAVYSGSGCTMNFTDTTIENNKGSAGAAVYAGIVTQASFQDCTITGNTGSRFGSAIYAHGGISLTDTAITGNLGKAHAVTIDATGADGESFQPGISQFRGDVIITDNEGGGLELLEGAFVNIHGDGLGEKAIILVTQAQGGITNSIFGSYDYVRQGDVYTLTKGDLALRQADPITVQEEEVPGETEPEAPVGTPASAKTTVLIVFGSLLAVAAVLVVIAILAVKKMKKRKTAESKN